MLGTHLGKNHKILIENSFDYSTAVPKQLKKMGVYMSLRNKFLSIFGIFSLIFILVGLDLSQVLLDTQEIEKNYMQQKEAAVKLYRRRDFIKSLLLIDDYENFIQKEKLLKINKSVPNLEGTDLSKDLPSLEQIEYKILFFHRENLKLNNDFSDIYKKEKFTRYMIRDLIYREGDYNEMKVLGKVGYKGREAIFLYRDKKHFLDWQNAICNLRKIDTIPDLLAHVEEYHKISHEITDIILSQNKALKEIERSMGNYNGILKRVDNNVRLLEPIINKSIEKSHKNIYMKLMVTLLMLLLFFIAYGVFLHSQLIKPLEMLKTSTRELAKKNFDYKISIDKKDEIGELAGYFNIMVNNLKSAYVNLENMVKERTIKLEESNSKLIEEMHEREKLEESLKNQVITDELTGLFNRRAAYAFLLDEIKKSKIQKYSLTICYLDIDDFKEINDNFGHEEGDRCLKGFSEILKLNLRQEDFIFRMGGDEFLVAFPNKHRKDVEIIFEERVLPELRSKLNIEFSYGIFEYSENKKLSLDEIIKRTDENMYKNKIERKKKTSLPLKPSFV